MADGVGLVRGEGVGDARVLAVVLPALQLLEGMAGQVQLQVLGGEARGLPVEDGLAGGGGGAAVGGVGGVGGGHPDLAPGEARGVGHELHEHRGEALADAGGAGVDDGLAVLDPDAHPAHVRQAHADAGVLHGAGDARVGTLLAKVLDGQERLLQGGAGVHDLPVGKDVARFHRVEPPDLPGGEPHLLGQERDAGFHGEAGLGDAEAAEGAARGVVGVDACADDVHVGDLVGTRGVGAGALQHRPAQARVGAGVLQQVGLHGGDAALGIGGHGVFHLEGVALGVDLEALLAAQGHLHGNLEMVGQERGMVLDDEILLAAEPAAHVGADHLHLLGADAQDADDALVVVVDALRPRVDGEGAVGLGHGQGALGLHEGVLGLGRVEGLDDEVGGLGDGLVRVAPAQDRLGQEVALGVELRGILVQGAAGVGEGLELFEIQLDHGHGGLGLGAGLGGHQGDGVAHVAGRLAHGDHGGPVVDDVPLVPLAGDVGGGEDGLHARHGQGLGGVDALDQHPGFGGTEDGAVQHAGALHVVHVETGSQGLVPGVGAADAFAHGQCLVGIGGDGSPFPEHPRGVEHRLLDLHVAGAPAHVLRQGLGDFRGSWIGVRIQQALGADDHAGHAEAALHGARVGVGPAEDVLLPLAQALHGHHLPAVQLVHLEEAGPGGLAVDEHHAGAAGAFGTAVLDGRDAEFLPKEFQEVHVLRRDDFPAVYLERGHVIAFHWVRPV